MKLKGRNENRMLHILRGRRQRGIALLTGMLLLTNWTGVMANN